MYNRYIPMGDGTYQKSRIPEPEKPECLEAPAFDSSPEPSAESHPVNSPISIGSFFQNLLPKDLDTEDLIVILLLLLISERRGNDSNQAMLTLGAYLFL